MRITYQPTEDGREAYDVLGDSGTEYRVTYMGSGDGDPDYVAVWECTCPAARYGGDDLCKHIQEVIAVRDYDEPEPAAGTVLSE